ncbi:GCN5 family acetyltransferase [Brevundimonas sp. Leaf280]|uniref:GNAT family N-acetyltransferase n=1 Tax=Brevundimonas sp. Leaf280 TaxID=1736320 RepID=UPI0006F3F774|nr:GNAT family N-acetyltransferase [Brevundimonas sp. Leaf280]KQP48147.1 GCN5 family acetyltransferase [Brevundimonas sp. Leaf280]
MTQIAVSVATPYDVAALHPLIERAYRGDTAKAGWTHEADLLFDDRTSATELSALIADPDRVILLAHRDGALIGCVQVARAGDDLAYLGMLTVEPTLQATGLGRRLLAAAENEAVARLGARRMEMTVIHRRTELIAWYERRGYAPTGETRPFPVDPPRPELEFVVLEKAL